MKHKKIGEILSFKNPDKCANFEIRKKKFCGQIAK